MWEKARREGLVYLETISYQANRLLSRIGIPTAYFYLGERFSYFFIDEFQDTSIIQWENIYPLLEEALSRGGELFLVGDTKQAIYQFRGGEVTLLLDVEKELEKFGMEVRLLRRNFRSRKAILDFVNTLFARENLERWLEELNMDGERILETYAGGEFNPLPGREEKEGGYVEVRRVRGKNKEEWEVNLRKELEEVLWDILQRYPPEDIAILTRKREEMETITQWLMDMRVEVLSPRTMNLRMHPLIQGIMALLRFLDKPTENVFFASFLLNEVFLKVSLLPEEVLRSWIEKTVDKGGYLYREFQRWQPEIWEKYFSYFYRGVGFLPPYDIISRILKIFKIYENFSSQIPFFLKLLELVKEREEEGDSDLGEFLKFWDKAEENRFILPLGVGKNAVKVMTIHSAKGLEFPVVILPFLQIDLSRPRGVIPWRDKENKKFYYLRYSQDRARLYPPLREIYRSWRERELLSELNVLYVGLTRAREELFVFLPEGRRGENLTERLFEGIGYLWGRKGRKEEREAKGRKKIVSPRKGEVVPWEKRIVREEGGLDNLFREREESLKRGESIHRLLAEIGRVRKGEEESIRKRLRLLAEREGLVWEEVERYLGVVLGGESGRWFYLEEGEEVFTEKEICDEKGNLFRLDRLLVGRDRVIVVDFKTGEEGSLSSSHREQVENYKRLLERVFPDKEIEGYLLYLEEGKMVEI